VCGRWVVGSFDQSGHLLVTYRVFAPFTASTTPAPSGPTHLHCGASRSQASHDVTCTGTLAPAIPAAPSAPWFAPRESRRQRGWPWSASCTGALAARAPLLSSDSTRVQAPPNSQMRYAKRETCGDVASRRRPSPRRWWFDFRFRHPSVSEARCFPQQLAVAVIPICQSLSWDVGAGGRVVATARSNIAVLSGDARAPSRYPRKRRTPSRVALCGWRSCIATSRSFSVNDEITRSTYTRGICVHNGHGKGASHVTAHVHVLMCASRLVKYMMPPVPKP